jgi:hypothetical protein
MFVLLQPPLLLLKTKKGRPADRVSASLMPGHSISMPRTWTGSDLESDVLLSDPAHIT